MKRLFQTGCNIIVFVSILIGMLLFPVGVFAQAESVPDLFIEASNPPAVAQSPGSGHHALAVC